jgi:MFS family permease
MRIAEKNSVTDHGITEEEMYELYYDYHLNLRKKNAQFFTYFDIFRYPSIRGDYFKASAVFFVLMFMLYGPAYLLQRLLPDIYISGLLNGVAQFATIPFMGYLNQNVSRRRGLMALYALTSLFTLFQFMLNNLAAQTAATAVLVLTCFFIARFFINMNSNFTVGVMNEIFPAQIRSICYCGALGIGRLSSLIIPYIPKIKQSLSLSYNLIFVGGGLFGILFAYLLRETLNIPPPEIIE